MRNGQNKHRMRGRNRSGGKNHNPLTRVYESNGPDVKIRGTANHVAEKYIQLARDATASGDPVAAENYYQHAEHYFRLIAAAQEQFRQTQPYRPEGGEQRSDESYEEGDDQQPSYGSNEPYSPREQQQFQPREQQGYQQREQRDQPYQPRDRDFQGRDNRGDNARDNRHHGNRQFDRGDRTNDRGNDRNNDRNESRQADRQPLPANGGPDEELGLPSFITGAPAQAAAEPNGHEGQGERFPAHRRRRRGHRGARPDVAGGADQGGEEAQPGE